MKKSIKDVIDKTWGTGKCDIPSVLEVIEASGNSFSKDDVLEIFSSLFSKQGLSSTPNELAQLIFNLAEIYNPHSVLDLCCGTGNILSYFKSKKATGVDVNASVLELARKLNPAYEFINADTLSYNFEGKFDLVVGSLPFGLRVNGKVPIEQELIKKGVGLLNSNGAAILVVPEGLLCSVMYADFRKFLLSNYAVDMVISLPVGIFHPFTNIKTSLLVLRNGTANEDVFMGEYKGNASELVEIFKTKQGDFFISISKLEDRLDRNYYAHIDLIEEKLRGKEVRKLRDIAEIIRGQLINKETLKTTGRFAVLNRRDKFGNQLFIDDVKNEKTVLKQNDIVIPLVGDNKLYVHKGGNQETVISENYAIIRSANSSYISIYLQTPDGQDLMGKQTDRVSVGTAIRRISIAALQNVLVPILPLSDLNFLDEEYLNNTSSENISSLDAILQQIILANQESKLHYNLAREMHSMLKAQEERINSMHKKLDDANAKLDSVLSCLSELTQEFSSIKNNKRDDEEKISRMYFDIDQKLSVLIKEQAKNIQYYESQIKKWLDDWSLLHSASSNFLTSAELIFDHLPASDETDYSPFIIQYCRALENEILKKLFEAYHIQLIAQGTDRKALVAADIANEKTSMFARFVDRDKRDYTLGNMNTIMSFLKEGGNTLKSSPLLQNFREFTLRYFQEKVIQKEFLSTIDNITSNYRNKSAHPYILKLDVAKECQKLIRQILSEFLRNYKGSSVPAQ